MIPKELLKLKYLKIENKNKEVSFEKIFVSKWQYYEKAQYTYTNFNFNNYSDTFTDSNQSSSLYLELSDLSIDSFVTTDDDTNLYLSVNLTKLNEVNHIDHYFYLRKLSFINFFINNMIDVPVCFKKSKSLKFRNFELPILRFSNFLMKKGKREKINRTLFKTIRLFLINHLLQVTPLKPTINWLTFHLIFNNVFLDYKQFSENSNLLFEIQSNPPYLFSSFITNEDNFLNQNFFFKNFILNKLSQVSPVFSYFIYSVDKNIRKFSRGKSGKYTFVWKFLAPYKRLYLAMRLIVKDVKFTNSKQLTERIDKTFDMLTNNIQKSLLWKSKIFSHNYVFKNFKKSLMSSLRTSA